MSMTDLERAFDEWLMQGGHNGAFNLKTAFMAGASYVIEKVLTEAKKLDETHEHVEKIYAHTRPSPLDKKYTSVWDGKGWCMIESKQGEENRPASDQKCHIEER